MIRTLQFELNRALKNRSFSVSLLIGLGISISHVVLSVIPSVAQLDNYLLGKGEYPVSVFNKWIGGEAYSFQPELYFVLLPILCCIPYVDSLFVDRKTGYTKNIYIRTKKGYYYASKLLAVFISAGLVITIPLVLNLILAAAFLPSIIPESSSMTFPLFEASMWSEIFYAQPYLYICLYILVIFLFSGLISVIGLTVAFFVKTRFVALVIPFMGYILLDFVCAYTFLYKFSPKIFLRPNQPSPADFKVIATEFIVFALITAVIYYVKWKNDEAY
ncbi:hypothetical protein [Parasporobacterium paucivorans]|uniref:ABC-2 family transporter protein n=1 Tax=Parasporobacterium paucivorans DSM 15970 TaxID=1122934 RepID=A0A1M6KPH1_9FIRM|nr:hypothetical protein [Parasporobacterium paucivorans]SHJ60815.1 hypothetical protein SAMN02745691_02240 [Parasporobacterium paucivorans DSM 15970]